MKKEIDFNESHLIGSMREALSHSQGKLTLKTTKVPRRTHAMSPASSRKTTATRAKRD